MEIFDSKNLVIQTFNDHKDESLKNGKDPLAQVFPLGVAGSADRIKELQGRGAGIYFVPNPQEIPIQRSNINTSSFSFLSLDLDVAKEEQGLTQQEIDLKKQQVLVKLKKLPVPPCGLVVTKNGLQPIWAFSDAQVLKTKESRLEANEVYKGMVNNITKVLGHSSEGDSLVRVIRFPGSFHLKDPKNPFEIKFVKLSNKKCTFAEFNSAYPPVSQGIEKHYTGRFDWSSAPGLAEGEGRNATLLKASRAALGAGIPQSTALEIALGLNQRFNPPLSESEFNYVFNQAVKYAENEVEESDLVDPPTVPWPKQLDNAALHGPAGEFVRIVSPHTEADPAALLINFLTTFGNIIGDKYFYRAGGAKHSMRLNAVFVAETSKGRKGTSWHHVKELFSEIEPNYENRIVNGLSSGEGLISAVKDEVIRKKPIKQGGVTVGYEDEVIEEGVKDKRLLVIEEEFVATLKVAAREGNTLSSVIRSAWDNGRLQTMTKIPTKATGAHISIIGHITPEELLRYLNSTDTSNGFANRFLWICVKRANILPFGGNLPPNAIDPVKLATQLAVLNAQGLGKESWPQADIDLVKNDPAFQGYESWKDGEIKFSEEAAKLWIKIYPNLSDGELGIVGKLTARAEAYVCRIAGIYALLDKTKEIRPEHLKAAIAIWDYNEASVRYIFQNKLGDPLAEKIIVALAKHPEGMTKTDIYNFLGKNIEASRIAVSVENLIKAKRIKPETATPQGRRVTLYTLNTLNTYAHDNYLKKLEESTNEIRSLVTGGQNQENYEYS